MTEWEFYRAWAEIVSTYGGVVLPNGNVLYANDGTVERANMEVERLQAEYRLAHPEIRPFETIPDNWDA